MKSLKESIEYTKKKKKQQITRLKHSHLTESIDALEEFLITGEGRGGISVDIENLGVWYHWNFINNFIAIKDIDYNLLAKSSYYHVENNKWCFFLGEVVKGFNSATMLKLAVKHLAQLFYLQEFKIAVEYGTLLLKKLYGKHYDGGISIPVHQWFMLELFVHWQDSTLEQIGTRYPDDMLVYKKALKYWNTTDKELFSKIVDELTKFHIEQSSEDEQETEKDENGDGYDLEFTSADYFIFPIEILMWLAIRREMGLPEYEPSPDNELMQMKINRLPEKVVPWPTDELVEKCKAKLKTDNPEIDFEI